MKYEEARTKPRVFQQLTGLKIEEFDKLKGAFQKASEEEEPRESPAGRKAVLRTYEDKLFFILFYLRHYPTQEVLGFLFGISQGQANQWIHRLTPIVKKALGEEKELPGRTAADAQELMEACPELEFILDGTERPVRRPQDSEDRRKVTAARRSATPRRTSSSPKRQPVRCWAWGQPNLAANTTRLPSMRSTIPSRTAVRCFRTRASRAMPPKAQPFSSPPRSPGAKSGPPNRRKRTASSVPQKCRGISSFLPVQPARLWGKRLFWG